MKQTVLHPKVHFILCQSKVHFVFKHMQLLALQNIIKQAFSFTEPISEVNWIKIHWAAAELCFTSSTPGKIKSLLPPHGRSGKVHPKINLLQ